MNVIIYHTNDFHSNFNNLKKVHAYIKANKTADDLYLDSGDYTDLSSIIVQADSGKSAMQLMVDSQLDAMSLGNNEIDLGKEALVELAKSGVPLLSTNIRDLNHKNIDGIFSSLILQRAGKRFLIVGLSPYYSKNFEHASYDLFFMMGGVTTEEPIALLKEELEKQKGQFDYAILLSHSGLFVDKVILEKLPEINLCLGGHTHDIATFKGYSQSGQGEKLGKITLEITDTGIVESENIQIDLIEQSNERFDTLYKEAETTTTQILSQPLPIIRELAFDALNESELINFICDALMKEKKSDLAIMHTGIAEQALINPVSKKSLIENFPSKLNPTQYQLSGKAIREAILLSFDVKHIKNSGKGPGFRGRILGTLGFSQNVQVEKSTGQITIDGYPLEDDQIYSVITDDYLQRGSGYPSLKVGDHEATFEPGFIRDLVEKYLLDEEIFASSKVQRVFEEVL